MTKKSRTAAELDAEQARIDAEKAKLVAALLADVDGTVRSAHFDDIRHLLQEAHDGLPAGNEKVQLQSWLQVTANLITTLERRAAKAAKE